MKEVKPESAPAVEDPIAKAKHLMKQMLCDMIDEMDEDTLSGIVDLFSKGDVDILFKEKDK